MTFDIQSYITSKREIIEKRLKEFFPPDSGDPLAKLHDAMRYSINAGGKRLRPILSIAASEAVGGSLQETLPAACAIEMIHTYSLIHDDLPSMDDDALRRGIPTNHRVFGEATAILAGDALLTDAFLLIADEGKRTGIPSEVIVDVIAAIARAAGSRGMVAGQALDLVLEGREATPAMIEAMHSLKTGAMIEASVTVGAKIGGGNPRQIASLREYARCLGLSFQIIDDVLDIEGGEEIGKDRGADARKKKATYPSLIGVEGAKRAASELTERAILAIEGFDRRAEPLREIAVFLGGRKY